MTPKRSHTLSPAARLNVIGLVVAAAGMLTQYASGVDYPTVPPAAVVAFGPWRRAPLVGLLAALFVSTGGAIATLAGNGFTPQLRDPAAVGAFAGTLIQIAGLLIALPAGVIAARPSVARSRAATQPTSPAP